MSAMLAIIFALFFIPRNCSDDIFDIPEIKHLKGSSLSGVIFFQEVLYMNKQIRKLTTVGMLCALAYIAAALMRIPLVLFLKYEPKDIIITIGGLLFGPCTSLIMTVLVSFIQMLTISGTGPLGFLMNILSSCSFACTTALFYRKRPDFRGLAAGLLSGCLVMAATMLLWNYFIAPVYMRIPRETVAELLLPAFLPFNLIKGGLNAAITMLLYKPVFLPLRRYQLKE